MSHIVAVNIMSRYFKTKVPVFKLKRGFLSQSFELVELIDVQNRKK
jgi:hypothetical protein